MVQKITTAVMILMTNLMKRRKSLNPRNVVCVMVRENALLNVVMEELVRSVTEKVIPIIRVMAEINTRRIVNVRVENVPYVEVLVSASFAEATVICNSYKYK